MSTPDPDAPIPVATADNDLGATLAASVLEHEGIRAYVAGTHTFATLPYLPLMGQTISVLVARRDHAHATLVLAKASDDASRQRFTQARTCPQCGFDREGLPAGADCPECGADADTLATLAQQWRLAPDTAPTGPARIMGAMGVTLGVVGLIVSIAFVVLILVLP